MGRTYSRGIKALRALRTPTDADGVFGVSAVPPSAEWTGSDMAVCRRSGAASFGVLSSVSSLS